MGLLGTGMTRPPAAGELQQGAGGSRNSSCPFPCLFAPSQHSSKGKIIPRFNRSLPPHPRLLHTRINTKLAELMEKDFAFWKPSWLSARRGPDPKPTAGARGGRTESQGLRSGSGRSHPPPFLLRGFYQQPVLRSEPRDVTV